MKREILFRGQRVDNKEWIYGNLVVDTDGATSIIDYADHVSQSYTWHDVIPESVGQFTGLVDKKLKLFQDDIFEINKESLITNFANSNAGRLMIKNRLESIVVIIEKSEWLETRSRLYVKRDGKILTYLEMDGYSSESVSEKEIQSLGLREKWSELSIDISFLRYALQYGSIIGNIHDNPELLESL